MIKEAKIKRITVHGLRHTHAIILINQKTSVVAVSKRFGNTAEEIHKTYGNSDDEADRQAVNVFDSIINM